MNVLVTGGAGFIGSHLSEALLRDNHVTIVDNFSTGTKNNLKEIQNHKSLEIMELDCTSLADMINVCKNKDIVFHFAANPDVRLINDNTYVSFNQNIFATRIMLEASRRTNIKKFIFASTSTVYGDTLKIPTKEDYGPLKPISIYGSTKLACESLVFGYSNIFNFSSVVLRFANIVGHRSNHGVIFDFYKKLQNNKKILEILGDGNQKKSYFHITDCINAILIASKLDGVQLFNVGSEDQITVLEIAKIITNTLKIEPEFILTGGINGGGWIGDVKNMLLDISAIKELGFIPSKNSKESVQQTISDLVLN
jgi:UDP-glucose 4-epimerase